MKVSEVMIDNPPVVTREDTIARAARCIDELHSSLVPFVDTHKGRHVVGVIMDKDVMRCTASGNNPQESLVSEYMDKGYETVHVEADVETALQEVPQALPAGARRLAIGFSVGRFRDSRPTAVPTARLSHVPAIGLHGPARHFRVVRHDRLRSAVGPRSRQQLGDSQSRAGRRHAHATAGRMAEGA